MRFGTRGSLANCFFILNALLFSVLLPAAPAAFSLEKEEYAQRRARLMEKMGHGVCVLFGAMETRDGEAYQDEQFYYLSGVETPSAILVLRGKWEVLYLPPFEQRYGVWDDVQLSPGDSAVAITGIKETRSREKFAQDARWFGSADTLWVNLGRPAGLEEAPSRVLFEINKIRERFPGLHIENISPFIEELRAIKSLAEIALLRESCRIAGEGVMEGIRSAEPGMYEYQVEAVVEFVFKREGSMWPAFYTIVGSGLNSVILHHNTNQRKMQSGDLVVLDAGAEYQHYGSDITRTFPVSGKFTKRQREIYEIVLNAQKTTIAAIKPGLKFEEIDKIAKAFIKEAGHGKYFIHGTSHFLSGGGKVDSLQPGMCLTVEPGIYIPEENLGVRIEDDVLVIANGCEVLTQFVPKEPEEIEKLVAEKGILQKK